jgi:HSP20 family molecular chaperone IbpA
MATTGMALAIQRVPDIFDEMRDILGDIELRSFELFERRGGDCGHDLDDWLAAESELVYETPATIDDHGDRVEIRIGLAGLTAQDVALLLADRMLALRGAARGGNHSHGKWLLVRVDLPAGVALDTATATVESEDLLVIIRKEEMK